MNVTRILVRVIGEKEWNEINSERIMGMMEEVLKAQLAAGAFDFGKFSSARPQVVTDIDLYNFIPPVPKDAAKAKRLGFLHEENPSRRGTEAHARWNRVYERARVRRFA
jgi:hypothetical protein